MERCERESGKEAHRKETLTVLRNVQAVRTPKCRRQDRSRLVRVSFDAADALTIVNIIVVICHKI